jgi:hypothetical protein
MEKMLFQKDHYRGTLIFLSIIIQKESISKEPISNEFYINPPSPPFSKGGVGGFGRWTGQ